MAQVMVAMSGGLDSTMAAALLVEQGHDVTGVHLKMADTPSGLPGKGCCTLDDARDARRVADRLGIAFYVWDFADAFAERVVEDFVDAYAAGRTPNPCVRCNERVKYAALMERALGAGFDRLATGHHVRLRTDADGTVHLHRPVDDGKDQTYVLYMAGQDQLRRSAFPVGEHRKSELRAMAAERGFVTAAKPDSHDICFIPSGDTAGFLSARLGRRPGPIVDVDGTRLGSHDGAYRFTVGQRRGLGIGGLDEPRFVTGTRGDTITVGRRADLAVTSVTAEDVTWTTAAPAPGQGGLTAQVRYHGAPLPVALDLDGDRMAVTFTGEQPLGVAPGQALVVYRDDECLGGGTITATAR
ncbi:tRNA 2-thiouridine(34) synthase MnmA [Euzebya sp.]|uniref:tRNA 2-thiouridine(34) synthase MnmA n=1 Tax=Euzebya sp. TaxID=1971409 RepID=UPI003519B903